MNTSNMSDEELDDQFRKSTENFVPPYDPEAWTAMEQKLNIVKPVAKGWKKYIYPLMLLLLLSSILTLIWNKERNETITQAGKELIENEIRSDIDNDDNSGQLLGNENQSTAKILIKETRSEPELAIALSQTRTVIGTSPNQDDEYKIEAIEQLTTGYTDVEPISESGNSSKPSVYVKLNTQSSGKEKFSITGDDLDHYFLTLTELIEPDSELLNDTAIQNKASSVTDSSEIGTLGKTKKAFMSSIDLMLVAAPDVTSVNFRDAETISANAGIMLGLPLSDKFSLVTGVIWSDKKYAASYQDYTPTSGYWTDKKKPSSINASCSILDIPLNIKYKILSTNKHEVSILTGLSSYIMLKENYTYNYTYGYHPYSKTSEVRNQNKHWFGVQNLAISYSRKISPTLSVGIEPFVKFPLSGIGAGQIKLTSAGVFLTTGYTIQLKSKAINP